MSYTDITNSMQVIITYNSVCIADSISKGGYTKNIITKIAPAINSTNGYCQEIFVLHFLQLPFCTKKLNSGINSFQVNVLPHDIHFDLPPIPTPVLNLSETTFKKLPTIVPNMNESTKDIVGIILNYFGTIQ